MSLSVQVLLPVLALTVGGLALTWRPRTWLLLLCEAAALAALAWLWILTAEGPISAMSYQPVGGVSMGLRVDRIGVWFAASGAAAGLLAGAAVGVRGRLSGVVVLAQAGAVMATLASSLLGLSASWALAIVGLAVAAGGGRRVVSTLVMLGGGAVLLLAGAVAVDVAAGTTAYESVPVAALGPGPVLLLGAAPVLALLGVASLLRAIPDLRAGTLAVVTVTIPAATYTIVRLYHLGGGRLPGASLGLGLLLLAGTVALGSAAWAAWAVDLGAFVVRVVQAVAALVLAGAATGTPAGLGALELGGAGLAVGTILLVSLTLAGGGRLPAPEPGGSRAVRAVVGALGMVAMAWVAGLPLGLALTARSLVARGAVAAGPLHLVVAAPALAAMAVLVVVAVLAGRFSGGHPAGPRRAAGPVLAVVASVALVLALPGAMVPALARLNASALALAPAEVDSALRGGTLPLPVAAIVLFLLLAAALSPGAGGRPALAARGWRESREVLPPELAVAPRVMLARLRPRLARLVLRAVDAADSRPGAAMALAWAAVVIGAAFAFTR